MAIDDSIAMSDLVLHREALAMNTPELVTALADQLGFKLVAYLGKVKETRAAKQWAEGTRELANAEDIERLRLAFHAASLIMSRGPSSVAQAWFQGLNPALGDASPARLLREGDIEAVGPRILSAARQFATAG
ncbi:hypothetical protein [Mycobacteroides abscessus]|nr:hypothetical protein [Mycobacteroides abscessus]EUA63599.1 hypothetical protein I542_3756 [Mycobacteroides abscessus 1948]ALM18935.1 hypothetical protein AOY11_24295 [Mycobacteroides abscessus]AMU47998.1 hypothetical protein A3O00_24160 [Mycobacteroides abscessus]AMU53037.1 hypothetical protein A3O01_24875 [Mycobacteroides abscessus]AMU57993.1 hypothetical protein A3O02_24510 [Mycobacteroides abscessus]